MRIPSMSQGALVSIRPLLMTTLLRVFTVRVALGFCSVVLVHPRRFRHGDAAERRQMLGVTVTTVKRAAGFSDTVLVSLVMLANMSMFLVAPRLCPQWLVLQMMS